MFAVTWNESVNLREVKLWISLTESFTRIENFQEVIKESKEAFFEETSTRISGMVENVSSGELKINEFDLLMDQVKTSITIQKYNLLLKLAHIIHKCFYLYSKIRLTFNTHLLEKRIAMALLKLCNS